MEKKLVGVAPAVLDMERVRTMVPDPMIMPMTGVLKLDASENTVGPSPKVFEAIGAFIRGWPLNWHYHEEGRLRSRISEYASLPQDAISCFDSFQKAIECIARTYLSDGVEAIIDGPAESAMEAHFRSTGAQVTQVHHENLLEPDIEGLINHIKPKTKALYISNPNSITGATYTEAEIVFLLAYAERAIVIVSEEYFEYSGSTMADLVLRFPNLVVVRSFANAFGLTDYGLSCIFTDPCNLEYIHRLKFAGYPKGLATAATLAAFDDIAHTQAYISLVIQSKKLLAHSLPEIGYEFKLNLANFILLRVADTSTATGLLRAENIYVEDLSNYDRLDGYLRITIGTPQQMDKLLMILSRIADRIATGYNRNRFLPAVERIAPELSRTLTSAQTLL